MVRSLVVDLNPITTMTSNSLPLGILLCLVCGLDVVLGSTDHHRVRRGNYGERYSGGIGAQSALGVGYGGTNVAGAHFSGVTGPHVVFDSLALKTVSVPNNAFVNSYQAQINSAASSGAGLDYLQQGGQHVAAYAGLAANQVGQWYNTIATGHVPPGYKGEY